MFYETANNETSLLQQNIILTTDCDERGHYWENTVTEIMHKSGKDHI